MKKYKIIIRDEAKKDVKEYRSWYNQQQKGLGKRFTKDLRNTLLSIARNPTSYAVRYAQNRKANLDIFPYGVFFLIDNIDSIVYVIAVMHNARDFVK
jgi:plasmid stabilization system protein ParE